MITAALENKKFQGFHVFVEGGGDFKLWRNFMQKNKTRVTICNGCAKVIEATILGNKKGIRCLGIIDRDFRSILGSEDLPSNIFMTDEHDIEMMMCHTDCLGKVLNNYDSSQKIDDYEEANGQVRDKVFSLTNRIGYLKLLNNLSAGEKSAFDLIMDMVVQSKYYPDAIYCIDEPETHMHTKLQGRVLRELYLLIPGQSQLWISTHSIGMLQEAEEIEKEHPGTVAFLDFGGRDFDNQC